MAGLRGEEDRLCSNGACDSDLGLLASWLDAGAWPGGVMQRIHSAPLRTMVQLQPRQHALDTK